MFILKYMKTAKPSQSAPQEPHVMPASSSLKHNKQHAITTKKAVAWARSRTTDYLSWRPLALETPSSAPHETLRDACRQSYQKHADLHAPAVKVVGLNFDHCQQKIKLTFDTGNSSIQQCLWVFLCLFGTAALHPNMKYALKIFTKLIFDGFEAVNWTPTWFQDM